MVNKTGGQHRTRERPPDSIRLGICRFNRSRHSIRGFVVIGSSFTVNGIVDTDKRLRGAGVNRAMDYWAKPSLDRQQAMLFYPTLDQSVSDDHPVRLLDEILRAMDCRPGSNSTMVGTDSRQFPHGSWRV